MAYEKQNWQTGEVITADKLNHMEDGIGGGSVESIKVATFTGGGGVISEISQIYAFNGSGALDDSKSLFDLIGTKKLVGFAYRTYDTSGTLFDTPTALGIIMTIDANHAADPRLFTNEERKSVKGGVASGIVYKQCSKVDVYAICI